MNRPVPTVFALLSVFALVAVAALVACAPAAGTARSSPPPLVARAAPTHGTLGVSTPGVVTSGGTSAPVSTLAPSATQASVADRAPGGSFGPDMPAPEATVVPTATPAPVATPTEVPYVAPDDPPQIVDFWISATTVHPGDVLSGGVTASSNVASVEVRVAGYSYLMAKTAPGRFELSATVPSVPRIFRRTYPLVAIARNTRGDATQRTTQITIR